MKDLLNKLLSLEIGMLAITKDKAKDMVSELISRGEVSQDEGRKMIDEFIARGDKSREHLKTEVLSMVADALTKLDVPTRKELQELKTEIAQLRKDLTKEMLQDSLTDQNEL